MVPPVLSRVTDPGGADLDPTPRDSDQGLTIKRTESGTGSIITFYRFFFFFYD